MRKLLLLILLLFLHLPARAQEPLPFSVYLPIIMNLECMSNGWQFVAPVATTNLVANPSAELTGNFAAVGAATVTQVSTFQKYGLQSYRVQTGANGQGINLTLGSTLTNQTYYATFRVRGKLPARWGAILKASPYIQAQLLETLGDGWFTYGVRFDGARANGSTFLRIGQIGPGSGDFYVDGIQVEAQVDYTTYCDGTQPGCAWDGAANASTSTRSGQSRAGGKIQDLYDDYGFFVEKVVGAGSVTPTIGLDPYALLPGAELNSIKLEPRTFTLVGKFIASTEQELHDKRQALITALSADTFPDNQPLILRFFGARIPKQISAYYQGGLEGDLNVFYNKTFAPVEDSSWEEVTGKFVERATIQFVAPDPFWYEIGESAASLDTSDSAAFRLVAGRLRSTQQWYGLGLPVAVGAFAVNALAEDATYLYIGGDFLNFNSIAAADNIVRYNRQTGAYSALGNGLNNVVRAITIGPDGSVYIGGDFTDAGGVAAADYLTVWNGTAFAAVGTPNTGAAAITNVRALKFDNTGLLYIGGLFTNWNNIANADYIVSWNGTAYVALSTGLAGGTGTFSLAVGLDNNLYVGGAYTTAGGVAAVNISYWDGTAFNSMSDTNGTVNAIAVSPSGIIYIGGGFSTAGGISAVRIASWNGSSMSPLGSGLTKIIPASVVNALAVGPDGVLWIGGQFDTAGGIALSDGVTRWNGFTYSHLDVDLDGGTSTTSVLAISINQSTDPVINSSYDVYLGGGWGAFSSDYGGKITATNGGSTLAFPKIVIARSGGTTAVIETLRNETNGEEILFNYSLLSGETLTIDLTPLNKSVVSSFFGPRLDAILPQSDFGTWNLQPSSNVLTSFVAATGAPTITAWLLWRDTFKSYD